ncbi:MAG TPA: FAD-dependent oxidoreductase [Phycisphaerae bacterium]|nr:FAD-dependent oxidoreductase [Phycisphaerae bacterium]
MSQSVHRDPVHTKTVEADGVVESPRRLPIRRDVDVLVCGGGPAGCGAALAAAREGARTLLVERHGMLGGLWTAGLLNPFFECIGRGYVVQDLIDRLAAAGAWRPWYYSHTFDVEVMARTLEVMAADAGVELLYHTLVADAIVEGDRVRGVVIESKAGRQAVLAKVVIDATGDGDVAARAGCAYEFGRLADGLVQPMTLMFEIRGAGEFPEMNAAPPLYDAMTKAIAEHGLDYHMPIQRTNAAPWIIHTPAPGSAAVQMTHVYRMNPLDPADLTRATIETRRQAHEAIKVLRRVPGLKKIELVRTAPQIGVRETRRILGRHYLTLDDLAAGRSFPDAVTACAFVVDIHTIDPNSDAPIAHEAKSRPYEIPYRCMLPQDRRGLLLSGRCISGSHEAHASYRVTGTAMAIGQAAGLAAAWAVRDKLDLDQVPGDRLRAALADRGARFLDSGTIKHHKPPATDQAGQGGHQ